MSALKAIFWASGFMVFYPYFGYLAALWLISLFRSPRTRTNGGFEPHVTLVISAYNEEKVIEDKILNSLSLDYAGGKLEVVVVSDGSNDKTAGIVRKYGEKGVLLRHYEGRIGKTACLNKAVPLAGGEIIVFSDANSKYDKYAVRRLVKHFSDNEVGFMTGRTKYASAGNETVTDSVGFYSKIEKMTKRLESGIGSCVGADGAIFAIRKDLYRPLKGYDLNDLVIPLNIIKSGFRGGLDEDAFCVEDTAGSGKGEFNRQVRITARTLRAIFNNASLLNPIKYGLFSFEVFSHKVLRLTAPFFLLALFMANAALIFEGPLYAVVFSAQSVFYMAALLECAGAGLSLTKKLFSASYTFSAVNAAILWGWVKYLKGETFVTWSPTKR